MKSNFFPAKILLFGEYGIIEGSKGFCIPYFEYFGNFKFKRFQNNQFLYSNFELKKYYNFLFKEGKSFNNLNIQQFNNDINNGIYFDSNIPKKYGIGSSGALVAAIYEYYSKGRIILNKYFNNYKIIFLKNIFSKMESFFHGKSSGIDPLISYLKNPIILHSYNDISIFSIPKLNNEIHGTFFLIDSGILSSTFNMMKIFFEKKKEKDFKNKLKNEFILYNNICIETFIKKDYNTFLQYVKMLSIWVYNNFLPMIPVSIRRIWKYGIMTNKFYLKLCGSGGGGFLLGITSNYQNIQFKQNTKIVLRF